MTAFRGFSCDQCQARNPGDFGGDVPPLSSGWYEIHLGDSAQPQIRHFCSDICLAAWIGPMAEERKRERLAHAEATA